jgi:CheY-like chemotaxis protein
MPLRTILQVEDDPNDVLFLQMAVKRGAVEIPLRVVTDGKQAIDYLAGVGKFIDREEYPLPAVVLLDLRLPRVPGHEVLRWIRRQPQFAALPVIILSASRPTATSIKRMALEPVRMSSNRVTLPSWSKSSNSFEIIGYREKHLRLKLTILVPGPCKSEQQPSFQR